MSRPALLFPLFAALTSLTGVGPKLAKLLEKLDVFTVRDLLWLLPHNIIDRRYSPPLKSAPDGVLATIEVMVARHDPPKRQGQPYRVSAYNDSGHIDLVLFNVSNSYVEETLSGDEPILVSGKLERYQGKLQMVNPDYVLPLSERAKMPSVEAVYPLTQGLTNKRARTMVAQALTKRPDLPEWCDAAFAARERFPKWAAAIDQVHSPATATDLQPTAPARRRLAYDELLASQLAMALLRHHQRERRGLSRTGNGQLREALLQSLPYQLTGDQKNAVAEIVADLGRESQMLRLLQGDVGAGKTIVALLSMLAVVETQQQAALMAPTEILARQHFAGLSKLCANLPINIAILTGREKGATRDKILAQLKAGEIHILIGTHALFQEGVEFKQLGLAVIDEQHRFGVHQRLMLSQKGDAVDILVMTATPIPRTLLLTNYGDMEVSKLREKPPGRQPIATRVLPLSRLDEVAMALGRQLAKGERAYWVCPLVEESEDLDLAAATERFDVLKQIYGEQVVLVHGQMKAAEKDAAMAAFAEGRASILVATTVIEVGVDVPSATTMVIEHAERFGLAQLHQLRGRVGRGTGASSCLLLYTEPLGEVAKQRLAILRDSEDGFRIAEEDLRLRGAGEMLGTRQSGLPGFRLADPIAHDDLLAIAHDDAKLIVNRDPLLKTERGEALRVLLHLFERQQAANYLKSG